MGWMEKPPKTLSRLLSVRIDAELYSLIKRAALQERRSLGSMTRYLLWMALITRESKIIEPLVRKQMEKRF
jgi:hypothetical protein